MSWSGWSSCAHDTDICNETAISKRTRRCEDKVTGNHMKASFCGTDVEETATCLDLCMPGFLVFKHIHISGILAIEQTINNFTAPLAPIIHDVWGLCCFAHIIEIAGFL